MLFKAAVPFLLLLSSGLAAPAANQADALEVRDPAINQADTLDARDGVAASSNVPRGWGCSYYGSCIPCPGECCDVGLDFQ